MRLLPLQGMSVGEGDVYSSYEADCYNRIMSILNDPGSEYYEMIEDLCGVDYARQALGSMVYSSEFNTYYDPSSCQTCPNSNDNWDLLGGEYADVAMAIEEVGEKIGVECGIGGTTIINSHQGTAGM